MHGETLKFSVPLFVKHKNVQKLEGEESKIHALLTTISDKGDWSNSRP